MTHDFAIVGAGIAGASLAAELAESGASVLILEGEDKPGYHATGRSAAFWEECYGGPEIVPLTLASGEYLRENGFLHQRGALYIAREGDEELVTDFMQRFDLFAVLEGNGVAGTVAGHFDFQPSRQRSDHRDAHAVKATREPVARRGELTARVKLGQDELDPGDAVFRVQVDRHAAAVILDFDGSVAVKHHADARSMTRQRLVDTVVDDLLGEVIGT